MKYTLTLLVLIFTCAICNSQELPKSVDLNIGQRVTIRSKILAQDRILNIYLPNGYSKDSIKNYPVIYVLDGSIHEDFIHIVGLAQFASFSWINMIPECIVVGIENINRYHDFTYPTNLAEFTGVNPDAGGSANFMDFIEKELKPFVEANYNCDSMATIIGQSLGGLLATEILFSKPNLFNNYIIVSPSLWWDDGSLLKSKMPTFDSKKQIFIAVGNEGYVMKKVARKLFRKTKTANNLTVKFKYLPKQNHGDALHLAAYWAFLHLSI